MDQEILCKTCKHGESLGTQKTKDDVEVELFGCWYKQDTEGKERSGRYLTKMNVIECNEYVDWHESNQDVVELTQSKSRDPEIDELVKIRKGDLYRFILYSARLQALDMMHVFDWDKYEYALKVNIGTFEGSEFNFCDLYKDFISNHKDIISNYAKYYIQDK